MERASGGSSSWGGEKGPRLAASTVRTPGSGSNWQRLACESRKLLLSGAAQAPRRRRPTQARAPAGGRATANRTAGYLLRGLLGAAG